MNLKERQLYKLNSSQRHWSIYVNFTYSIYCTYTLQNGKTTETQKTKQVWRTPSDLRHMEMGTATAGTNASKGEETDQRINGSKARNDKTGIPSIPSLSSDKDKDILRGQWSILSDMQS